MLTMKKRKNIYINSIVLFVVSLAFFIASLYSDSHPDKPDTTTNPTSTQLDIKDVNAKSSDLYEAKSIVDGDTIKILYDGKIETVRLIGIDTPETKHPTKLVECFGKEASNYLKDLISGKSIAIEVDLSQGIRDRYSRLLLYLFLEDGTNINEKMIRDGYAYEYTYNKPYKYQYLFKEAEKEAKENGRGLWNIDTCSGER